MSVSLKSENHKMNLGYARFYRVRLCIARLVDAELGTLYSQIAEMPFQDEEDTSRKLDDIRARKAINEEVIDFLYACDCDGEATQKQCEAILGIIEDYNGNDIPHEFKQLIQDGARSGGIQWY